MEGNIWVPADRIVVPIWEPDRDEPETLSTLWESIGAFPIVSLPAIHQARHGGDLADVRATNDFDAAVFETFERERAVIAACTSPFWSSDRVGGVRLSALLTAIASRADRIAPLAHLEYPALGRRDFEAIAALRVAGFARRSGETAPTWQSTSVTITLGDAIKQIEAATGCAPEALRRRAFREPLTTHQRRGVTTTVFGSDGEYDVVLGARPGRLRRLDDRHDLWAGAGRLFMLVHRQRVGHVYEATPRSESSGLGLPVLWEWRVAALGERFKLSPDPDRRDDLISDGLARLCGLPIV